MLVVGTGPIEFYSFFIDLSSHFSLLLTVLLSSVILIVLCIEEWILVPTSTYVLYFISSLNTVVDLGVSYSWIGCSSAHQ